MYHFINNKGVFIDCRNINNTKFYEIFVECKMSFEESETPIYNQILEQETIELHKLTNIIKHKNGFILDLSTDCVPCVFPDGVLPFKLESNNIKGYYYDNEKEFPKYKLDNKPDDHRLKVSKMKNFIRTEKFIMDDIEWNIINDVQDNNIEPLINNILDNNLSINIDGRAGTGKSFFINKLQKEMKKRNITYKSLAYTNKACRIINGTTIHKFIKEIGKKLNDVNYNSLI